MPQRPEGFRINRDSPLYRSAAFLGLQQFGASTSRYHDSSMFGNTGTLTNMAFTATSGPVWVPQLGRPGVAYGGTNQYIRLARVAANCPCTMLCWFLTADASTVMDLICIGNEASSNAHAHILEVNRSAGKVSASSTTTTGSLASSHSTASFTVSAWQHAAAFFGSATMRIAFLNGVAGSPDTSSKDALVTNTTIGANLVASTTPGRMFTGIIADPLIFNRALSLSEIQQLADPSNTMLSGLLLPPRRRVFAVSGGAAPVTANRRRRFFAGACA